VKSRNDRRQGTGNRQRETGTVAVAHFLFPVSCLLSPVVLLLLFPAPVLAQTGGVVVLTFTGDNAAASRNAVVGELRNRVELIARDQFESARNAHLGDPDPDVATCRAMGGRAIVAGETVVERAGKVLRTRVRSCSTGAPLGEQATPWRGRTLAPAALTGTANAIVSAIESESTSAAPPPIEAAPPPPPETAAPPPEAPSPPPGEGWLELAITAGLGTRSLDVAIDPDNIATEPAGSHNTALVYSGGAYVDGGIDVSFYPFRLALSEPRGLGLHVRYLRALAATSEPRQEGEPAPDTVVEDFLAEAFFRIPLGDGPAPTSLRLFAGYDRFAFVLTENPHLPEFIYQSIRPGVGIYLPISGPDFAAEAAVAYRLISGPGAKADDGLGTGTASGLDLSIGVRGDVAGGFFWGVVGEYIPISLTFESEPGEAELHRAGSGTDTYLRGRVFLGWRFE